MLKMSKSKIIRFLITAYIEIIRGTPLLLQLMLFYFVLPELIPIFDFSEFTWVAIALCINSSAYVSEIFRSGIQSVDKGQTEAARSLGLSSRQTMMRIVMPQAIKNILPAIANEFVVIIKESAIAYTIGVPDLMAAVNDVRGAASIIMEPLLVATAVYFCLCFPTSKIIAYFERRMSRGDKR
jgi:polar amino acid transport system permease protein